jgi:phosphotransferase system enzyme I (PtsI)
MSSYFGKTCSPGIAIGPAVIYSSQLIKVLKSESQNPDQEVINLKLAFEAAEIDIHQLIEKQKPGASREILQAHLMMLQDPEWMDLTLSLIRQNFTAAYSLYESSAVFKSMLQNLDDEYLKARAHDMTDLSQRVLRHLLGKKTNQNLLITPSILVAPDLLPSEFLSLDRKNILGLILENASNTSHTAILAKTFEIPCVVGLLNASSLIQNNDLVLIDALKAQVKINPDQETHDQALKDLENQKLDQKNLEIFIHKTSISLDQIPFEVASNLSCIDDMNLALTKGTEGCGLFRSEFLLLDRKSMPTESEQFEIYKTLVSSLSPHKAVIRIFDIGGDKQLNYLNLPKEENPFLGLRGLRLCLSQPDVLLKPQLRALLRAAQFGRLSIMAPMVTTLDEVLQFKKALKDCEQDLLKEGLVKNGIQYETGIMVEVPAIALILKDMASHLDFISVGTNDLIQYLCATDRMNTAVSHLHDAYHPAVLRFLNLISTELKDTKVWMGLCGELAAQNDYVPLLMALGFKELSVSPGSLLKTRAKVCKTSVSNSLQLLDLALKAQSSGELKQLLKTLI